MYIRKFLVLHSKDFTLLGKTLHISIFTSLKQFSGTLSKRANIYKVSGLDILNVFFVSGKKCSFKNISYFFFKKVSTFTPTCWGYAIKFRRLKASFSETSRTEAGSGQSHLLDRST